MPQQDLSSRQELEDWFLELLACPGCEERLPVSLNQAKDALVCACGRYAYPIRDGIPVLLVEEARILDENARPEHVKRDDMPEQ